MKSEPGVFGIDDLRNRPGKTEPWDGIRNYQARNFIRDGMKKGDSAFFYHSSCEEPGITGIMRISSHAYADPTAFDRDNPHFDPKSDPQTPRWFLVDMKYQRKLKRIITLRELQSHRPLQGMRLLQRGNRLSIIPVTRKEWDYILALE